MLAIDYGMVIGEGGGAKSFHPLEEGGAQHVLPCLEGGGGTRSFGPAIFPSCSPPPPLIINSSSSTSSSSSAFIDI